MPNMPFNPMQLMQMFQGAKNPQQMFQNLMQQNPQINQTITQLKNSSNNANPKDIAMQLAKQRGVPEQQVMQWFNQIGGSKR